VHRQDLLELSEQVTRSRGSGYMTIPFKSAQSLPLLGYTSLASAKLANGRG
jgi:hypothetical protein